MWRTLCVVLGSIAVVIVALGMFLPSAVSYEVDDPLGNAIFRQFGLPERNIKPDSVRPTSVAGEVFSLFKNWAVLGGIALFGFVVTVPVLLTLKYYDECKGGLTALTIVNALALLSAFAMQNQSPDRIRAGYRYEVVWETWIVIIVATGFAFLATYLGKKFVLNASHIEQDVVGQNRK